MHRVLLLTYIGLLLGLLVVVASCVGIGELKSPQPSKAKTNVHAANPAEAQGLNCDDCHFGPSPTKENPALRASTKRVCLNCHTEQRDQKVSTQHPPFVNGECTVCHRQHGSNFSNLLVAQPKDLCATCHSSIKNEASLPVVHGPFKDNECGSCHDAHGSNQAGLLKAEIPKVCWSCHADVEKKDKAKAYQHVPFANGQCNACHLPHASQLSHLQTRDTKDLCLSTCHGKEKLNMDFSHEPVAQGQCLSCHLPHSSDHPRMLVAVGTQLCVSCHIK